MSTALEDALWDRLIAALDTEQPCDRWVMSGEWRDAVRGLEGSAGEALLIPSPAGGEFLFGMPVEIREDGGVPHLEAP